MRPSLLIPCGAALVTALFVTPARGQDAVTTTAVGKGLFGPFGVACPTNMLVIGIASDGSFPTTVRCSLYNANGQRFGGVTTQTLPNPTDIMSRVLSAASAPFRSVQTVDCPGDRAVSSLRMVLDTGPDSEGVLTTQVFCAGVGANGGQTTASLAGSLPSAPTTSTNAVLVCPVPKFARAVVGVSAGVALECVTAPLIATTVSSVALASQHTVSGTPVHGTVSLNGYAVGQLGVLLGVTGAPGAAVPTSLAVSDGATSASFQVQSAVGTAGCGTISATLGTTTVNSPIIFTPAPPAGAPFTFALFPASTSLVWGAPSVMTAIVVTPPSRTAVAPSSRSAAKTGPSIVFQSDHPELLAIQLGTQTAFGDTVKVTMNALAAGCVVVTATVDGVAWRKTVRLLTGF